MLHKWRDILDSVKLIDWNKCLCKCYTRACGERHLEYIDWNKSLCKCYTRACRETYLNKSTGINVYVYVAQEHVERDILDSVEKIDCTKCLCKCYMSMDG
jgi:hypothetical protein